MVVGDLHLHALAQERDAYFADLWRYIRRAKPQPQFVAFLGDLTEGGLPGQYEHLKQVLGACPVPWVLVRGNHDKGGFAAMLADADSSVKIRGTREEQLGRLYRWNSFYWDESPEMAATPLYARRAHYPFYEQAQPPLCAIWDGYRADYAFEAAGWRFVIMDTARWAFSSQQLAHLEEQLDVGQPTVLLMHHHLLPVRFRFDAAALWQAPEVLRLMRAHDNLRASLHGHVHFNRYWDYHGRPVVTTGFRHARVVHAAADGQVRVGPAAAEEPAPEPYAPWNLAASAFSGDLFYVDDTRLWRFDEHGRGAGKAWGGQAEAPQGMGWRTYIDNDHVGRPCQARLCMASRGPWRARVTGPEGEVVAQAQGVGAQDRQEIALDVEFARPADYTVELEQPEATESSWMRSAHYALLDFGDTPDPPLWCWGGETA
jgi:3',5'-cyclic AMP phosphodiesterase CpdA